MFSACFATFTTGINFCWTSPSIPILISNSSSIDITYEEASYFTVIPALANIVASPFYGHLLEVIGRKYCVLLVGVPQLVSLLLIAIADSKWILYASRFVAGVAEAAMFTSVPIYIGEVVEPRVRSSWGHTTTVVIFMGQFVINVIGTFADIRTTALICAVFPVIHMVVFSFAAESPYYLFKVGKDDKAEKALQQLRWRRNVDEEIKSIQRDVKRQLAESSTFKDLLTIDSNRKALLIMLILRSAQQLSGLPAFETYTSYMFKQAGGDISHSLSAIIFMGVLAVAIAIAPLVVGRYGTRRMTILSCLGCAIVLSVETAYFVVSECTTINVEAFKLVPLVGMLVFIIVCALGLGIVPTFVSGVIFSASIKGKASAVSNVAFAILVMLATKTFQVLEYNFGLFAPFILFTICSYVFTVLIYYCIPETKGRTLEEIQQALKGNTKQRDIEMERPTVTITHM